MGSFDELPFLARGPIARQAGINDGQGLVFISHTGEVYPSGFLPISAGNIRLDSLVDVYRRSPLFVQLRNSDKLKGKCGRCKYRNLCGGSCSRAYAHGVLGLRCQWQALEHDSGLTT